MSTISQFGIPIIGVLQLTTSSVPPQGLVYAHTLTLCGERRGGEGGVPVTFDVFGLQKRTQRDHAPGCKPVVLGITLSSVLSETTHSDDVVGAILLLL